MSVDTSFSLILNSFTLALAISFLIIVLWYDVRRRVNFAFAVLLILVACWNTGFLLTGITDLVRNSQMLPDMAFVLTSIGFTGSGIALYALMTVLVGVQPRHFRFLVAFYFLLTIAYTLAATERNMISDADNRVFLLLFYVIFDALALYITWRYRRKLRNNVLVAGVVLFVIGAGKYFSQPGTRPEHTLSSYQHRRNRHY